MSRLPARRRRERRIGPASDLTITSMVDMFTMILTFLLNFVDPAMGDASPLSLPTARATASPSEGVQVEVSRDGIVVAGTRVAGLTPDGRAVDPAVERSGAVLVPVTAALRGASTELPLVLSCDRSVPFAVVGEVLQSARAAGFQRYRFVVDREVE